jgi:hypothetical protein
MLPEFDAPPKELMSTDLKDVIPDEEALKAYQESFISIMLMTNSTSQALMGSLLGIEISNATKLDVKIPLDEAFAFLSHVISASQQQFINSIVLNFGDEITKVSGPFLMSGMKIVELDAVNKTCVLAMDLIKQ